jgi:hypothetical protein
MGSKFNQPGWAQQTNTQRLTAVAGAAANTNIALAAQGVTAKLAKDTIFAVCCTDGTAISELPKITSDGFMQFPVFVSTGKTLIVLWGAP